MKRFIQFVVLALFSSSLYSQEALKSTEEEYYDFLSLQGITERPTINYRTLSDSEWTFNKDENGDSLSASDKNIWKDNNLGTKHVLFESSKEAQNWFTRGIDRSVKYKIYGPEWFNSYNTAAPYGQNDGGLWQGKGYNTSFTAGARLEAYGFELTFKPQMSWSQNREFEYIKPAYATDANHDYANKADTYGYYGIKSIDAPQRFGDDSFFNYDWGDTEIRYTWKNLTTGFGTQSIWLGPAQLNPIIHSNNAPSYPKFDIGLRKTPVFMPHFGWYLGDFEARGWWGKLSESDYFDNDSTNDNNLIAGLALGYSFPGILEGLSVGMNRTMLSKWNDKSTYSLFNIFVPGLGTSGGSDENDQRVSFIFDYKLESVGFETYFEWARNDFSPNRDYIIRYPFHTQAWTFGIQKTFGIADKYSLIIQLEFSSLETSSDYDRLINWYTTFYSHHIITQGYTNEGQWLGTGIGTGGNSQYLGFTLIHPKGSVALFVQRRNPDLDYTMYIDSKNKNINDKEVDLTAEKNIRAFVNVGVATTFFLNSNLHLSGSFILINEHNPLNINYPPSYSDYRNFIVIQLGAKYNF